MRSILAAVLWASVIGTFVQKAPAERGKILAQTIETASQENFRLGESSILSIDGRKLMLASAIFGKEGHDDSPAEIHTRLSDDGGRTWRKAGMC